MYHEITDCFRNPITYQSADTFLGFDRKTHEMTNSISENEKNVAREQLANAPSGTMFHCYAYGKAIKYKARAPLTHDYVVTSIDNIKTVCAISNEDETPLPLLAQQPPEGICPQEAVFVLEFFKNNPEQDQLFMRDYDPQTNTGDHNYYQYPIELSHTFIVTNINDDPIVYAISNNDGVTRLSIQGYPLAEGLNEAQCAFAFNFLKDKPHETKLHKRQKVYRVFEDTQTGGKIELKHSFISIKRDDGRLAIYALNGNGHSTVGFRGKIDTGLDIDTGEWVAVKIHKKAVLLSSNEEQIASEVGFLLGTTLKKSKYNNSKINQRVLVYPLYQYDLLDFFCMEFCSQILHAIQSKMPSLTLERSAKSFLFTLFLKLNQEIAHFNEHRRFIHRDLKPENILINWFTEQRLQFDFSTDDIQLQLVDFDFATKLPLNSDLVIDDSMGTCEYMAPELFSARSVIYSKWTEIYSLGIVFKELMKHYTTIAQAPAVPNFQVLVNSMTQNRAEARLHFEFIKVMLLLLLRDLSSQPFDTQTPHDPILATLSAEYNCPIKTPIGMTLACTIIKISDQFDGIKRSLSPAIVQVISIIEADLVSEDIMVNKKAQQFVAFLNNLRPLSLFNDATDIDYLFAFYKSNDNTQCNQLLTILNDSQHEPSRKNRIAMLQTCTPLECKEELTSLLAKLTNPPLLKRMMNVYSTYLHSDTLRSKLLECLATPLLSTHPYAFTAFAESQNSHSTNLLPTSLGPQL